MVSFAQTKKTIVRISSQLEALANLIVMVRYGWAEGDGMVDPLDKYTDECEGPPDWKDLADNSGLGINVNGSVCLNNLCM